MQRVVQEFDDRLKVLHPASPLAVYSEWRITECMSQRIYGSLISGPNRILHEHIVQATQKARATLESTAEVATEIAKQLEAVMKEKFQASKWFMP